MDTCHEGTIYLGFWGVWYVKTELYLFLSSAMEKPLGGGGGDI